MGLFELVFPSVLGARRSAPGARRPAPGAQLGEAVGSHAASRSLAVDGAVALASWSLAERVGGAVWIPCVQHGAGRAGGPARYDLKQLLIGSEGTLGVITACAMSLPQV